MDQAIEEAYIQQSVEFFSLTVATTSLSTQYSQFVRLQPPSPIHSIVSTFSPMISQTVIPIIPVVITTTPTIGPFYSQSSRPVMEGRYAPLVLLVLLNVMLDITNLKL